jgi:hypothetical protein
MSIFIHIIDCPPFVVMLFLLTPDFFVLEHARHDACLSPFCGELREVFDTRVVHLSDNILSF